MKKIEIKIEIKKKTLFIFLSGVLIILSGFFLIKPVNAVLTCAVTTTCISPNVTVLKMYSTSNSHAGLPGSSSYTNFVCCGIGATGLGIDCNAANKAVVGTLSGTDSAHYEDWTKTNYPSPANDFCLSVDSGTITVATSTSCASYDTTIFSFSGTSGTNAHVGTSTAYTIKICGTVTGGAAQSLTFSISDSTIGFGALSASAARFANGATTGDTVEVGAHTLSASTNATGGYIITVRGATLTHTSNGSFTISAIGGTNTVSAPNTEQFGLRATTAGPGTVTAPYAATGFAYAATVSTASQVASGAGDGASTIYSARYIANISAPTEAGSYSTTLTYVATATF